jgi:hypothetical protein
MPFFPNAITEAHLITQEFDRTSPGQSDLRCFTHDTDHRSVSHTNFALENEVESREANFVIVDNFKSHSEAGCDQVMWCHTARVNRSLGLSPIVLT